jgi:hypothetical protein
MKHEVQEREQIRDVEKADIYNPRPARLPCYRQRVNGPKLIAFFATT